MKAGWRHLAHLARLGQTRRAFLLPSSLHSETRSELGEFYSEFATRIKEYLISVKANEFDRWSYLFLPCDLFGVCIYWIYKYSIYSLIKFIENLRDSKGWYFSSHYMHSDIKFRNPISVDVNIIKELYMLLKIWLFNLTSYAHGVFGNPITLFGFRHWKIDFESLDFQIHHVRNWLNWKVKFLRACMLTLIYWNQHKWFYVKKTPIILKSNMSQPCFAYFKYDLY